MKIFAVEYNPLENEGIYALSVVEQPAMQSQWVTLNENKLELKTIDDERRILMGVALIPNKPIYRKDRSGEYNIVFSKNTIEKAAHDFVKKGNVNNSTIEHEIDLGSDAVSVVESWIVEDDVHDKSRKFGFKEPVGSWCVMMKVHSDEIWAKAKKGEIKGFSIDAFFDLKELNVKNQVNMSEQKKSLSLVQKLGKALLELGYDEKEDKKVKMASVMTADGLEIMHEAETLEAGVNVFVVNEDERVPLPVGEYKLEDEKILVIAEEGIVAEIKDAEPEQELEKDEEKKEEVELTEKEMNYLADLVNKTLGLSEMKSAIEKLNAQNVELKSQLEQLGEQPATKKAQPKKEVKLSEPKTARERILAKIQKNK